MVFWFKVLNFDIEKDYTDQFGRGDKKY